MRRTLTAVCAAIVTAAALSACTSDRPDPAKAAEALAKGLSAQDLADVPMTSSTDKAQQDLERIVTNMGTAKPKVTVDDVEENGDSATARLRTSWKLAGSTWKFTTEAPLTYVDDMWRIDWKPAIVAPELAAGERLRLRVAPADRGDIVGARSEPLITERRVERVGIDKTRIKKAKIPTSAEALARLLDIDVARYVARVEAA